MQDQIETGTEFEGDEMIEGSMETEIEAEAADEDEAALLASDEEASGDAVDEALGVTAEDKAPKAKKEKAPGAHEAFIAACDAHASALGLTLIDQKGYKQYLNGSTKHRLYVAKQAKEVTVVATTLPEAALPGLSFPLEKENGRIACNVLSDETSVKQALEILASFGDKIRAPKKVGTAAMV